MGEGGEGDNGGSTDVRGSCDVLMYSDPLMLGTCLSSDTLLEKAGTNICSERRKREICIPYLDENGYLVQE